jgi:uncharacterized protein (DUF58 family)
MEEGRGLLARGGRTESWAPPDIGSAHPASRVMYCVPIPTRADRSAAIASPVDRCFLIINVDLKEQTAQVLRTLTPREEKIMKMRFGLEDGSEHTLEEVGRSFAVTRERIRQIEAKALRKLRQHSRSRKLKAFLAGRA